MKCLLSDGGPNLVGVVIKALTSMLVMGRMQTYPLHPQANGTVERWNRTLTIDLARFVSTGQEDWDDHVALACYTYNTGVFEATGMLPYQAIFGVDPFEAWVKSMQHAWKRSLQVWQTGCRYYTSSF